MKRTGWLGVAVAWLLTSCGGEDAIIQPLTETTWEMAIGTGADERAFDLVPTADGAFVLAGQRGLQTGSDALLTKVDRSGNTLWEESFGTADLDVLFAVAEGADGNLFAVGTRKLTHHADTAGYVVHSDDSGKVLWERLIDGPGDDEMRDVVALPDGGCVVVGTYEDAGSGGPNVVAAGYQGDGTRTWQREYGGVDADRGFSVAATVDGGFAIAGSTRSVSLSRAQACIFKIDAAGTLLWEWVLDSAVTTGAYSIAAASDGGFLLGGYTLNDAGDHDAFALKLSSGRDVEWIQNLGDAGLDRHDDFYAVAEVSPEVYAAVGRTSSFGAQIEDAFLTLFHGDGRLIGWTLYGEHSFDEAYALHVLPGGGFVIAGTTRSIGAGGMDIFLIRTDGDGEI